MLISNSDSLKTRNLGHIETMRAFAALSVAGFHFIHYSGENGPLFNSATLKNVAVFGAQGVELFFIISGFIIPFALDQSGYKLNNYFRYLGKRLVRLFPPYLAAIAGIIIISYLLCRFVWYTEYDLNVRQTLVNIFFLGDVFPDFGWINPIFKTLKVELQFYILMGLIFPLVIRNNWWFAGISVVLMVAGILTKDHYTVLLNAPFFLVGLITWMIQKNGNNFIYFIMLILTQLMLLQYFQWEDLIVTWLGIAMLIYLPKSSRLLSLTGKISYSFYLIHGLTGGWFLYFATRNTGWLKYNWLLFFLAIIISWVGAYILYRLIEKPCLKLSAKISYEN